jgi:phage-related minor tail protein
MNGEPREPNLTTADLAASANRKQSASSKEETRLAPLFTDDTAKAFRSQWDVVQRGFVDDPQEAVRAGDELVAQVIKSLAESFSDQRSSLEGEANQADQSSTENLRLALRRYRSFFERLLAI